MIRGNIEIKIIQGDFYQKNVKIENVDVSLIESIYFSCHKLNICKKLEYDNDIQRFKFVLQPEETKVMQDIRCDYDITIKFVDDKIKTASYRGSIVVLPKINEVRCLDDE